MREAFRIAREGMRDGLGGPFGAVIVKGDDIVGRGSNMVLKGKDPTAHAEIVAVRDACRSLGTHDLSGCQVFCTCEPCPMCLGALYWARVDEVWFAATREDAASAGFDDSLIYEETAKPPEERKIPMSSMLRDEALGIFEEWLKNPRRIPY